MDSKESTIKIYSENLYSTKSDALVCSIANKCIDGVDNIFVVIEPNNMSSMYMDNSSLHVGNWTNKGREFLEMKGIIEGEKRKEVFSCFRGMIFNYPSSQLTVEFAKDHSTITCDIIRVKGGYKRKSPYFGYAPFSVEFIEISVNGDILINKQISSPDEYDTFVIKETPKIGQILSRKFTGVNFLDAIDLEDYIDGVSHKIMNRGNYHWREVKGSVNTDSQFDSLELSINLDQHIAKLFSKKNLHYREYQVISHASMDPGPDDCYESTDKYLWAAFSFDESYLLNFLVIMASVSTLTYEKGYFGSKIIIKFVDIMTKARFEELTGIHLAELVEKTTG